jgi:hypothetical protein
MVAVAVRPRSCRCSSLWTLLAERPWHVLPGAFN